jgi:hypothetical protein
LKPWRKFSFYGRFLKSFDKKSSKNTFEKVPFLLVRFLWANKENEQDPMANCRGLKCKLQNNDRLNYSDSTILLFERRLKHY